MLHSDTIKFQKTHARTIATGIMDVSIWVMYVSVPLAKVFTVVFLATRLAVSVAAEKNQVLDFLIRCFSVVCFILYVIVHNVKCY